jgi:hypothetical protein
VSQVSTETEVPDKTVIEEEPKERIEDEYRDNEKILYKTRVTLLGKKPEEADCFVTEGHVVIEAREPIKIPMSRVQECDIAAEYPSVFYPTGTATLTFLDDLNKKHKLSLEMAARDLGYFKQALAEQVEFPTSFLDKLTDPFRDHTRDDICAGLQRLGVDVKMAVRGRAEEKSSGKESLGVIDIPAGPIRWVNVCKVTYTSGQGRGKTYYFTEYGVPDPRLEPKLAWLEVRSVRMKNFPLVGRVVDLRWEGKDSGLGIIKRLNSDISIKAPIMRSRDVKIRIHRYLRCWIMSTKTREVPSAELWDCYQAIARHLLADWSPSK